MVTISSENTSAVAEEVNANSRFVAWLQKLADILLAIEPLWVIPILAYSYFLTLSLVPGPSYLAWAGLSIACIPFILRKLRWGYFSVRSAFEIPAAIFLAGAIVGLIVSIDFSLSIRTFQSLLVGISFYYSAVNYKYPKLLIVAGGVLFMTLWFIFPVTAYVQQAPTLLTENPLASWLITLVNRLPLVTQPSIDGEAIIIWRGSGYGVALPLLVLAAISLGVLLFSHKTWLRIISFVVCVLLLLVMYSMADEAIERLLNGTSINGRLDLWKDTIHMIKLNPITGLGLGMPLLFTYGIFNEAISHPHNSYLELYANTGILGVIAGVVCLLILVKLSISIIRGDRLSSWYSVGIGFLLAIFIVAFFSLVDTFLSGHIAKYSAGYYYVISLIPWGLGAGLVMSDRILRK